MVYYHLQVLDILEAEGADLVLELQDKCRQMQEELAKLPTKVNVIDFVA